MDEEGLRKRMAGEGTMAMDFPSVRNLRTTICGSRTMLHHRLFDSPTTTSELLFNDNDASIHRHRHQHRHGYNFIKELNWDSLSLTGAIFLTRLSLRWTARCLVGVFGWRISDALDAFDAFDASNALNVSTGRGSGQDLMKNK